MTILPRIEDAYTAIDMLRMVNVTLIPADNNVASNSLRERIPVVNSPFVRSVCEYMREMHFYTHVNCC